MKGDLEKRVRSLLEEKNRLRNTIGRREHLCRQLRNRLTMALDVCDQQQAYIEELEQRLGESTAAP